MEKGVLETVNNQIAFNYEPCDCEFAVIILHGLAEHKERYCEFMHQLKNAGIPSFAMDLRGHGESSGPRGDVDGFDTFVTDLAQFVNYVTANFAIKRLVLFGHSLGGQIVAAYCNCPMRAKEVTAVVLSSPAVAFGGVSRLFRLLPYKLCGKVKVKKRHSESREMLEYSRKDPLACKSYSLRLLGAMFVDGKRQAEACLKTTATPTLIVCGQKDPLLKTNKLIQFVQTVNNKNIALKVYPDVKHRIVQNEGCETRIRDIIAWIQSSGVK